MREEIHDWTVAGRHVPAERPHVLLASFSGQRDGSCRRWVAHHLAVSLPTRPLSDYQREWDRPSEIHGGQRPLPKPQVKRTFVFDDWWCRLWETFVEVLVAGARFTRGSCRPKFRRPSCFWWHQLSSRFCVVCSWQLACILCFFFHLSLIPAERWLCFSRKNQRVVPWFCLQCPLGFQDAFLISFCQVLMIFGWLSNFKFSPSVFYQSIGPICPLIKSHHQSIVVDCHSSCP